MEETKDLSAFEELLLEIEKLDDENIDTSISLECLYDLDKLLATKKTVRQIYDIEGLNDMFIRVFNSIENATLSIEDFEKLNKIMQGLFSNIEIDYLKIRLEENE